MNPIGGQVVMIFNIKRIMETAERTSELLLEILSQIGFLQTRKACLQRYNPTDQELIKDVINKYKDSKHLRMS